MLLIDHLAESMYSQSKTVFFYKKGRKSSSNDLPRFKRISTRCVQKAANNFWLCRKGKPFAHHGHPLPSIDKTMEQPSRSTTTDEGELSAGRRKNNSIGIARPASGFKGLDRATVAPPTWNRFDLSIYLGCWCFWLYYFSARSCVQTITQELYS